jgi:amino acid transporter
MANTKKFGTFSGVFTPSILTILGVIMYMRLPAIVGEAGLIPTIGIILVAHIISVTTGLSVSSIATDRRVQGGGTYYMVSRSLGLPIGGTLGIALFIGLSFSVSLYLIGFSESFLGYWGVEITKNTIRLTGTIILLVVTSVTLISTSLAIKTQYIIMGAIGLSLMSIILGNHDFAPARPFIENPSSTVPLMVLFGIFFPAVTGFEAGVSMSGDLRNPKKSIPIGAITAITVGFIVYIGMAVFFAYTVEPRLLVEDPGVLLKISLSPELVIAGIWGATLSSALGSILGAPRILQATAQDNIVPKFFAKSSGKFQEPRNALILAAFIAEAGILIGELNVIARIVSIFFIMTYGFINLSAAFETWTSAEFRPEFRTPSWISFVGAAACVLVMIQLDLLALFAAALILGLLFFYLKRKELALESGDAWSGVWATIVRAGIAHLGIEKTQESNWRPNIIMYGGNEQQRSHLVQFGKAICGRLGILSSFELIKSSEQATLRRSDETLAGEDAVAQHTFSFRYYCNDIYEGMEEVSRLYGFHGMEPNTILMGWSRNPDNLSSFSRLLGSYNRNRFNIILLNHKEDRQFGEGKTIDVWWNEAGPNLAFSLVLLRYMIRTPFWNNASLRLLVINYDRSRQEQIHRDLEQILENYRLQMDIKIISNQDAATDESEVIRQYSYETDLTLVPINDGQIRAMEANYSRIDDLLSNLGTTALIHGHSIFEAIDAGVARAEEKVTGVLEDASETRPLPEIPVMENPILSGDIRRTDISGTRILDRFYEKAIRPCFTANISQVETFRGVASAVCNSLQKALEYHEDYRYNKTLLKIKNDYLFNCRRLFEQVQQKLSSTYSQSLASGIGIYVDWFNKYYMKFPRRQKVPFYRQDFVSSRTDPLRLRLYKVWKRTRHKITGSAVTYTIRYRKIARHYLYDTRHLFLTSYLQELQEYQSAHLANIKSFIFSLMDSIVRLEDRTSAKEEDITRIRKDISSSTDACIAGLNRTLEAYRDKLQFEFRQNLIAMAENLQAVPGRYYRSSRKRKGKYYLELADRNRNFPDRWLTNLQRISNKISLDILMIALRYRTMDRAEDFLRRIIQQIDSCITNPVRKLHTDLDAFLNSGSNSVDSLQCSVDTSMNIREGLEEIREQILELTHSLPDVLLVGDETEEAEIPVVRLGARILETRLIGPLQEFLESGNESLRNLSFRIHDLVNLTRFSLQNIDRDIADRQEAMEKILGSAIQSVGQEQKAIDEFKTSFQEEFERLLEEAFDPLSPEKIEKSSGELSEILREYAGQKVFTTFGRWRNTALRFLEQRIIQILYSKSESVLLARKLKTRDTTASENASVLDLVQAVNPKRTVLQSLPRFYLNLFSIRSSIGSEFFIERDEDEGQMRQAVNHYKNGYKGGILILGERNAGKTAFCKQIAAKLFPKNNIIHIFAPNEGSARVEDLSRILEQATGFQGTPAEIIASLAHGTIVVIHDLELWFEQRRDGTQVIKTLAQLMDDFSERILFIANTNPHSFALINSMEPIQQRFIGTFHLSPFSTEELKEMILRRHRSSGVQFHYNGRDEKRISEFRMAALFDSYFAFSEGNPGTALNAWLTSIHRASGSVMEIRAPGIPSLSALRKINEDRLILLSVFALHKRLTIEQLNRITGLDRTVLGNMLQTMQRCGLIEERGRGILVMNMFLEPFIIKVLSEKQIL